MATCLVMEQEVVDLTVDSLIDSNDVSALFKIPPISKIQLMKAIV